MRTEAAACTLCLLLCAAAQAEPPRARPGPLPEDILPSSELDDPIGVDEDSRTLDSAAPKPVTPNAAAQREAARAQQSFGPEPPALMVREGEVLTASAGTREQAHAVEVQLAPGFSRVRVELRFEARTTRPGELAYRLAVPRGSRLTELEVCNANGCRKAQGAARAEAARAYAAVLLARPLTDAPVLPIAHASELRDARGDAIALRAAPLSQALPLRVRVSYVTRSELHGGVLRLRLPARGMDPQVAPAELRVTAANLIDVRAGGAPVTNGATSFDPWAEIELAARVKSAEPARAEVLHFPCGARSRCGYARVWAGPQPSRPVDLVIALDVSPSTEGEARGRLVPTIAALLAMLPEGSRVRALAFAARARPLIDQAMDPARVELAPFARAVTEGELGSATRFEAVWELASRWLSRRERGALRPLIAIVGDGGLTASQARAFESARAAGVEVSAINTADRATPDALRGAIRRAGGIVVHAAAEAEDTARGRDPSALHDALRALFAPVVARGVAVLSGGQRVELGALRAGEQLTHSGPIRGAVRLQYGARTAESRAAERGLQGGLAADALGGGAAGVEPPALVALDARDLGLSAKGWPEQPAKGCERRGPAQRHGGLSSDAQPLALAAEPVCKPAAKAAAVSATPAAEPGRGMPADPLLSMLRQRILPVARGCFRRDRGGRPTYQKRAVFAFTLAEREVVSARVEGPIPAALRQCLLAAVDTLEVPRFTGVVRVRYPLVTESAPLPEQVELQVDTAGNLDRLFGGTAP